MQYKFYTTTIVLILMALAFSRGFVLQYQNVFDFGATHVHAQAAGDGGGSAGGTGDGGGSAGSGTGDGGGSAGGGTGDGGGSAGGGTTGGGPNGGPTVVYGCMDPSATNYNPQATSGTGFTCTYVPVVYGCMDPSATNYNPQATSGTGVTCTYPVVIYGCMDPSATNYNPQATSGTGVTCTYPPAQLTPKCTLIASPNTIQTGSSSSLSWTTTNATSFSIDQGIGSVTPVSDGSTSVTPASSITYTGTAVGAGGSTTCTATITVSNLPPPPPTPQCTLRALPKTIAPGEHSTLKWTTSDVTSFSIDQGIGSVTPVGSGSLDVSPVTTTTYTGTATGPDGTATCHATVTVSTTPPPPNAPSCTLSASPTSVSPGDHTTLTWTTTNGGTFTIDNGIGAVSPAAGGSVSSKAITTNTTFTGTVVSPGGQSATCTASVSVSGGGGGGGPSCSLTVTPSTITTGGSATLSWGGSGISTVDIDNGIATATTSPGSVIVAPTAVQNYTYTGTFHATNGQTLTCTATLAVGGGGGGAGGGGGGGGGAGGGGGGGGGAAPTITLAALPHVGAQPLAYLYLSQIPYTGLDLGPVGTVVYWLVLIVASLGAAYVVLFAVAPWINRKAANFGDRVIAMLNTEKLTVAPVLAQAPATPAPVVVAPKPAPMKTDDHAPKTYSSYEGFKSFAKKGALSIDDIVKGLAREQVVHTEPVAPNVEPIYEHVEPIATEAPSVPSPIQMAQPTETSGSSADVRGFVTALLQGDREAVFAGLRQQVRGGGSAEKLISSATFLLDDVYRARIDGTPCDEMISRIAARFPTPTLEKLVASLTTAIDSSYSADVTGAKLALTRALTVIGA